MTHERNVGSRKKRVFTDIYELGVYPKRKASPDGSRLFAYLVPSNPTKNGRIYKLNKVSEVVIYENGKLKDRYRGNLPARTVRMDKGTCEYDADTKKLMCQTDDIFYMKKRGKLEMERRMAMKKNKKTTKGKRR